MNYLDQNYKHVIKKAMLDKTTDRRTYKILRTIDQDPYPEDYGRLKIGLWPKQYRANRSWKNTRGHQYR